MNIIKKLFSKFAKSNVPEPLTSTDPIFDRVALCITWHMVDGLLAANRIKPESTMSDLGLDSLDCIELILDVEEEFNIEIDDELLYHWTKVSDIVDHLKTRI